ncbi:unnamed protein product [Closterium sp. NIES-64]|nr:unnamed protein product [Closterium sp. NIES-64]
MLLLLRPDHLGLDATSPWKTRFVRVCHPTAAAEHLAAVDHIVKWFRGHVCLYYGSDSVQCVRAGQLGEPTRLVDLPPCGPLACGLAFDRVLNDLDAVVGQDPAPRIAKPIAMTLNTLRQDAKRAAKELAFRSQCGIVDGHRGDAHGNDRERSHKHPAGSRVSGRDNIALNTALALANTGVGDQGKPDNKEEGSSSDRDKDAPVNVPQGGDDNNEEEADEAEGQGRGQDEAEGQGRGQDEEDAAEDHQRGDLELEGSKEMEEEEDHEVDEEEEEVVAEITANNSGRSFAGKSPVLGKRKHSELVKMAPEKLAAEILHLNEQLKNQTRKLDEVASAVPGAEFAVVITQKYEELKATVEKVLTHVQNTYRVIRREAKLAAKERAENRDMREVLKRAPVRLEDCAGSKKGVVVDSMERAQKKLTDEVTRKIDGATATSPHGLRGKEFAEKEAGKMAAEKEAGKKATDKETVKRAADKETGKRVADKEAGKCESSSGGKRQKGVAMFPSGNAT